MQIKKLCRNNFIKALAINAAAFAAFMMLFQTTLSIDDNIIAYYLYGAHQGFFDHHSLYITCWYGRIVEGLLSLCGTIPWYTILFFVWDGLSLTIITYFILDRIGGRLGFLLSLIPVIFFGYDAYINLQFTKEAAFVAVAGFLLIFGYRKRYGLNILGLALAVLSYQIRSTAFLMILAGFTLVYAGGAVLRAIRSGAKSEARCVTKSALLCAAAVGLSLLLSATQYDDAEDKEAWNAYLKWSESARVTFQDYTLPSYEENTGLYESLGISENDAYFWYCWNYDDQLLTPKMGETIQASQQRSEGILALALNLSNLLDFLHKYVIAFLQFEVTGAVILLGFLAMLHGKNKWAAAFSWAYPTVLFFLLEYYLYLQGRYFIYRVDMGLALLTAVGALYLMADLEGIAGQPEADGVLLKYLPAIAAFLLLVPFGTGLSDYTTFDAADIAGTYEQNRLFYAKTSADRDHYYVLVCTRDNTVPMISTCGTYDIPVSGIYANAYVTMPTPVVHGNLAEYGIENPYLDAVDSDVIYLVLDEDESMKDSYVTYVEEHTGHTVELIETEHEYGKHVYRVVSVESEDSDGE